MGQERAPSFLPTLVKFEFRLVQLFGLWIEVDVRRPWLLHVLEHSGLSACRTSLSATTLGVIADTSDVSRDRMSSAMHILGQGGRGRTMRCLQDPDMDGVRSRLTSLLQ